MRLILRCIVSIPYGTIKSKQEKKFPRIDTKFQFLMVQLKVFAESDDAAHNFVSIPYGTIKRHVDTMATNILASFNSLWYN